MKKKTMETLANKVISDNITTGHMKILFYLMAQNDVLSVDVPKILDCSQQYANKLLNELLDKGYVTRGKIEHTRIYCYTLAEEN